MRTPAKTVFILKLVTGCRRHPGVPVSCNAVHAGYLQRARVQGPRRVGRSGGCSGIQPWAGGQGAGHLRRRITAHGWGRTEHCWPRQSRVAIHGRARRMWHDGRGVEPWCPCRREWQRGHGGRAGGGVGARQGGLGVRQARWLVQAAVCRRVAWWCCWGEWRVSCQPRVLPRTSPGWSCWVESGWGCGTVQVGGRGAGQAWGQSRGQAATRLHLLLLIRRYARQGGVLRTWHPWSGHGHRPSHATRVALLGELARALGKVVIHACKPNICCYIVLELTQAWKIQEPFQAKTKYRRPIISHPDALLTRKNHLTTTVKAV